LRGACTSGVVASSAPTPSWSKMCPRAIWPREFPLRSCVRWGTGAPARHPRPLPPGCKHTGSPRSEGRRIPPSDRPPRRMGPSAATPNVSTSPRPARRAPRTRRCVRRAVFTPVTAMLHAVRPVGTGHHRDDVIAGDQIVGKVVEVELTPPAHFRPRIGAYEGNPHIRTVRWRTEPRTMVATSHRSRARAPGRFATRPNRSGQTGSVFRR
jgi:hypothetical protein